MASWQKDKDGLFRRGGVYYCTVRGRRISTRCRSRKAAIAVREQLERAAFDPVYRASFKATIGELAVIALAEVKRRGRREGTVEYYEAKFGQLVRVLGADTPLSEITAELVDGYIDARRSEDAGQSTISKELGALRHMLRVAKRRKAWSGEIGELFPIGFASGYEPRRRAMTVDEIRALLAVLQPHRQAWVAFAICTGARESEVARGERADISPSLDVIQIRGTKTELADDAVAVPAAFRWLLELALELGAAEGPLVGEWPNSMRDLAAACRRAGIPKVSANDLRRTHGTLLRAAGAPLDVVARQLRHADSRMAERVYARLTAEQVRGLLPAPSAPPAHGLHSAACSGVASGAKCWVDEENRTPDNWSHNPVADGAKAANPGGIGGAWSAGGASVDPELHAYSTGAWALALAAESLGLGGLAP